MTQPVYTLFDLLWAFLCAVAFVLMFLIQKKVEPGFYFESSDVIYGFKSSTTLLGIVLRVVLIVGFGFLLSMLFRTCIIPVTAAAAGSFLVVWPALLHPDPITYLVGKKKWLLYVAYGLFIVMSISGTYVGCVLYGMVDPVFQAYWRETLSVSGIFRIVADSIIGLVFLSASGLLKLILRKLDKHIRFR